MNPEKIEPRPFDRGDPAYRWKLWVTLDSTHGEFRHYFWRRIGLAVAAFALLGWFAATAGVWANVKYRRPLPGARYADLAIPWRWSRYRAEIAADYLELGRTLIGRGDPAAALNYLDAAIALEPASLEGRRLASLAQFRLGFKPAALALLRAGIPAAAAAGDEPYLRAYFEVAFATRENAAAFAAAGRLLPAQPDRVAIHGLIALEEATACYNLGHYREAERILTAWSLLEFPEGEILFCRCESELGSRAAALSRLQGDLVRFTHRDGICVALERLAREQGLPDLVRRFALLRGFADPGRPEARVDLLYADQALGGAADLRRDVDAYRADFGSRPAALVVLSQFAADTGQPDVAEGACERASACGLRTGEFHLRTVQARLVARDYRRAVKAIAAVQNEEPFLGPSGEAVLAGMKAVALFGAGDGGAELAFSAFLPQSGALAPSAGLFLADQLRLAGFARQSRQVLDRVCASDPAAGSIPAGR